MLVNELAEELSRAHQDVPVLLCDGSELKEVLHFERDAIILTAAKGPGVGGLGRSEKKPRHPAPSSAQAFVALKFIAWLLRAPGFHTLDYFLIYNRYLRTSRKK